MQSTYSKEMPGAEAIFRPDHLADYDDEPWEIRISIGNAPLDEAYVFPVESFADSARPIRELIEAFALNPARADELETDDYPELPFLQQELIQCYTAAQAGQLSLTLCVNHCAEAVDLDAPAADYLSACTFRNKTWDYLVLDLIFELDTPSADEDERARFCERYADLQNTPELKDELCANYERFGSVAIAPCALGVPDGFDVRLQMMEFDDLDIERCALLNLLQHDWMPLSAAFDSVREALAYKTHFSSEILTELKQCGDAVENS